VLLITSTVDEVSHRAHRGHREQKLFPRFPEWGNLGNLQSRFARDHYSGSHCGICYSQKNAHERVMELNQLSSKIIKAAISVHKQLGPGLLESVYQTCMIIELRSMGIDVEAEVPLPIFYRGQKVHEEGFRMDLLVEKTIIVELKSVDKVQDVHKKQLLTYLRMADKPLGLLINFNEGAVKDGITRIINVPPSAD